MKLKKLLPIAVMFLLGLSLGIGTILANHPWICTGTTAYHWATTTVDYADPVKEKKGKPLGRNAGDYISAFNGAIHVWQTTVMNLIGGTKLRLYYDAYGFNGWLGLATIYPSNCVITRASSKLNDSYLRNTSRYSQTNVDHVACQEVGHTFGLDHNRVDTNTCMNDTILTAGNQINQHDYDQLVAIYGQ